MTSWLLGELSSQSTRKSHSSHLAFQLTASSPKSPYTLSYGQQIKLCLKRGFWRLKADPSLTFFQLFGNSAMALILGSVFYNMRMSLCIYRRMSLTRQPQQLIHSDLEVLPSSLLFFSTPLVLLLRF
jgi:hypothetical protein